MSQPPKWHLDRFILFGTAHPCAQHTDKQTTLRATSVVTGRISCTACRRWGQIITLTIQYSFPRVVSYLSNACVQNFFRNLTVKEFCKSVYICRSYARKSSVLFFFETNCIVTTALKTKRLQWQWVRQLTAGEGLRRMAKFVRWLHEHETTELFTDNSSQPSVDHPPLEHTTLRLTPFRYVSTNLDNHRTEYLS